MSDGAAIRRALIPDMMQSVAEQFAKLLDNGYRVSYQSWFVHIFSESFMQNPRKSEKLNSNFSGPVLLRPIGHYSELCVCRKLFL